MSEEWYSVRVVPATRIYEFSKGRRRVHREIGDWFRALGVSSEEVGFRFTLLPSSATMETKDRRLAMLFKLKWGYDEVAC